MSVLINPNIATGLKSRDATTVFSNQNDDCVSEQWKILRTRNVYTTNRCNTQKTLFPWNRYPKLSQILSVELKKQKSTFKHLSSSFASYVEMMKVYYHFSKMINEALLRSNQTTFLWLLELWLSKGMIKACLFSW